jgi:GGDEF domain-containing protein
LRIDNATGIFNATYFSRLLQEEFDRNPEDTLSIGIVELSGLQDYIGTLPLAGLQSLLIKVTEILRRELRGNDIIARWNEISFALMLPSTSGPASTRTLNRIYQALLQPVDLPTYGVSVNLEPHIGGAVYSNNLTAKELLGRAQNSLEQARGDSVSPTYIWELKSPFWIQDENRE